MAHELDLSSGKPAIAFVGDRKAIWHGLGQSLTRNSPIETWEVESGMNWKILESEVGFKSSEEESFSFPGKKVLYRSDNKMPLSIVSESYKLVQPKEVLEFFRDIVSDAGMYIDTAGCLFDGKRFWASAYTNNALILKSGDRIDGNLLLTTSCDGTNATSASFVATRVVCNNTLNVALGEADSKKSRVKVSHRTTFNASAIKNSMGIIDSSWDYFKDNVLTLNKINLTDKDVKSFITRLVSEDIGDVKDPEFREIEKIMSLYSGKGMGSDLCYGTAYGVLNAVTEHIDWHGSQHSDSSKLWNAIQGKGADFKVEAFNELLKLAA